MIKCQKCGTLNTDSSPTCAKCGAKLPPTGVATEPVTGRSKPAAPGPATEPVTGRPRPSALAPATEPAVGRLRPGAPGSPSAEPSASSGEADWLASLRGSLASDLPADEPPPDWLRDDQPVPPGAEAPAFDLAARLGEARPAEADVPDWLKQLEPTPKPKPPAAAPAEEDVPDWLKQLAPTPPRKPASAPAEEDVPDWLKQPLPAGPSSRQSGPAASPEADVPDWLKQPVPTPAFSEPPVLAEPELPDWLKQIEPSLAAQAPPASLPESQMPGWLQQSEPAATELPAMSAAEVPDWLMPPGPTPAGDEPRAPAQAELPEWLKQLQPATEPAAPVAESPALLEPEQAELPDWLKQVQPGQKTGAEIAQAPSVLEPAVGPAPGQTGAALPDWLQELETEPIQASPVSEAAALVGEPMPQPSVELPDWLKELGPSAEPSPIEAGLPAPPPAAGGLVAAQIPAWLQSMRPQELSPQEPERPEPVESEGLLAGLAGVLQAAEIVKRRAAGPARPLAPEIPAADRARAGALQEILAGGTVPIVQREPESRAQRAWNAIQRLFVFLLVLAAVLLPLGQEQLGLNINWVSAPSLTPSAGQVYAAIDRLDPGSPVLVSVDYDATQSAEMDVQALVLLRHLAARQVQVQMVSLYPTGPAVAQIVVDRLNQTLTRDGQLKVENLGYVPGQDTGIAFIRDRAASSALVIELAATPDTVRWWAEQTTAQAFEKPLLVGMSAAAEPMSLPYYSGRRPGGARQITGMLAGVPDATAYRLKLDAHLSGQDQARVLAPMASISLANTLLAALIVLGALLQLVTGGGKRR